MRARGRPTRWSTCALAGLALAASAACRNFTKEAADTEVYGLLGARRATVPEVQGTLELEARERLAAALRGRERFRLTLRDALELATVGSREYRRQREAVYLAALDLTQELNRFRPLWDAGGSVDYRADGDGSEIDVALGLTLRRAFERGGSVVVGLASDFLRDVSGNPLRVAQTILSADVVLPLLRGSGELVARENLTQAERDVLYALRDYARFQQTFTVDVATRFYRALQSRDGWQNAEARYRSLELLVTEQRDKAEAGRLPKFQVDQVEQDLLEADDARQRARNGFETAIDRLKLDLGIPVAVEVVLDDSDLESLRAEGPRAARLAREAALAVADRKRLDLRTQRDREEDAVRRVAVTRDALRAGLDLRLGGDLRTPDDKPLDFADAEASGGLGLDLDLPLERTTERNTYRRALIQRSRAQRDRERLEDTVVFEVRDAYRNLAEAERSYEIQEQSLRLAERRVESTTLLLERGDVQTRERLEAEDALVRARNALTAALVDHALARLALERDLGVLEVDAQGMWHEPSAPAGGAAGSSEAAAAAEAGTSAPPPVVQPPVPVAPADRPAPRSEARGAPAPRPAPAAPAGGAGGLPPPRVIPRRSGTVDTP